MGVHDGHFASILLWQVFSLFESICTAHGYALLSMENIFLESGMVSYSMGGKTMQGFEKYTQFNPTRTVYYYVVAVRSFPSFR